MGWWTEQLVPRAVDATLGSRAIDGYRRRVTAGLHGTVVELGFGSGRNLAFYPPEVTQVLAVEPSGVAWERALPRIASSPVSVTRVGLDGARLPLPDASADAVVSTFTLCTIPDVEAALREVVRVLRPGGRLQVVEHGRAPEPRVQAWQARLEPLQKRLAGGCHLTRPIADLVGSSGLALDPPENEYAGWPKSLSYLTVARATRVAGPPIA